MDFGTFVGIGYILSEKEREELIMAEVRALGAELQQAIL